MTPCIPVSDFIDPSPGSRHWKAIQRAIDLAPNVELVGEIRGERYYRVRAKSHDRHCVIIWRSALAGEEVVKCDCEAHYVPQEPTPCFHIGSVLIYEATQPARKLASMKRNGRAKPSERTERANNG